MNISAFVRVSIALSATALLTASGVAIASPATAATVTVTSFQELNDAIVAANTDPDADTIVLGSPFALTDNLPIIATNLTITGAGSGLLTIDAAGFEAFGAESETDPFSLTMSGFTLANTGNRGISTRALAGIALNDVVIAANANPDACGLDLEGADVHITNSAFSANCNFYTVQSRGATEVIIEDSSFSGSNYSGFTAFLSDSSTVTLRNVTANDNEAYGFDITAADDSTLTITGSSASRNAGGHGVWLHLSDGATAVLSGVAATGNSFGGYYVELSDVSAADLGNISSTDNGDTQVEMYAFDDSSLSVDGIVATGSEGAGVIVSTESSIRVSVKNVWSSGNTPGIAAITYPATASISIDSVEVTGSTDAPGMMLGGFGPAVSGTIEISRAVLAGNDGGGMQIQAEPGASVSIIESTLSDNGIADGDVGGLLAVGDGMDLEIASSTLSGNRAPIGAGIIAVVSELKILNSTISGNSGEVLSGLIAPGPSTSVTIEHTTITNNTNTLDEAPVVGIQSSEAVISHTIVAGNSAADDLSAAATAKIGHSFVQVLNPANSETIAALNAGTGNIVGAAPQLGPLADNGGLTKTHLPLAGSRVIDAGNPAISGAPATDQRGAPRIARIIDIGAVETVPVLAESGFAVGTIVPLAGGVLLLGIVLAAASVVRRRAAESRSA